MVLLIGPCQRRFINKMKAWIRGIMSRTLVDTHDIQADHDTRDSHGLDLIGDCSGLFRMINPNLQLFTFWNASLTCGLTNVWLGS